MARKAYSCRVQGPIYGPHMSYKAVDERQVKKLAEIGCTYEEMSHIVGCSVDTLSKHFSDIIKAAQSAGRQSLRHKQYQIALEGNPTMLIWLGKHQLGQKDVEGEDKYKPEAKKLFETLHAAYKSKKPIKEKGGQTEPEPPKS